MNSVLSIERTDSLIASARKLFVHDQDARAQVTGQKAQAGIPSNNELIVSEPPLSQQIQALDLQLLQSVTPANNNNSTGASTTGGYGSNANNSAASSSSSSSTDSGHSAYAVVAKAFGSSTVPGASYGSSGVNLLT